MVHVRRSFKPSRGRRRRDTPPATRRREPVMLAPPARFPVPQPAKSRSHRREPPDRLGGSSLFMNESIQLFLLAALDTGLGAGAICDAARECSPQEIRPEWALLQEEVGRHVEAYDRLMQELGLGAQADAVRRRSQRAGAAELIGRMRSAPAVRSVSVARACLDRTQASCRLHWELFRELCAELRDRCVAAAIVVGTGAPASVTADC